MVLKSNPCLGLQCNALSLWILHHTLRPSVLPKGDGCNCQISARITGFLDHHGENYWDSMSPGKKHILNLPVIFPLMGTLAPFSKHIQSFLSQFGIKIISLNAFNFRIIFSFDWHKVYHSRRENINTYLNKGLNNTEFEITYLGVKVSSCKY